MFICITAKILQLQDPNSALYLLRCKEVIRFIKKLSKSRLKNYLMIRITCNRYNTFSSRPKYTLNVSKTKLTIRALISRIILMIQPIKLEREGHHPTYFRNLKLFLLSYPGCFNIFETFHFYLIKRFCRKQRRRETTSRKFDLRDEYVCIIVTLENLKHV